jgi:hypothetical protein
MKVQAGVKDAPRRHAATKLVSAKLNLTAAMLFYLEYGVSVFIFIFHIEDYLS